MSRVAFFFAERSMYSMDSIKTNRQQVDWFNSSLLKSDDHEDDFDENECVERLESYFSTKRKVLTVRDGQNVLLNA